MKPTDANLDLSRDRFRAGNLRSFSPMTFDYEAKISWARQHAVAFEQGFADWRASGWTFEYAQQSDGNEFIVLRVKHLPTALSLVFGDLLQNLRTGLNHLVLELAQAHNETISERALSSLEFPIFGPKDMSASDQRKRIGLLPADAQMVIRLLQPYNSGSRYETHPLWMLHELSRIDRHRVVLRVESAPSNWHVLEGGNMKLYRFGLIDVNAAKDGSVVGWIHRDPIDPNEPMVLVDPFEPLLVFGLGPFRGTDVLQSVGTMFRHIEGTVVPPLEKYLCPGDTMQEYRRRHCKDGSGREQTL